MGQTTDREGSIHGNAISGFKLTSKRSELDASTIVDVNCTHSLISAPNTTNINPSFYGLCVFYGQANMHL